MFGALCHVIAIKSDASTCVEVPDSRVDSVEATDSPFLVIPMCM